MLTCPRCGRIDHNDSKFCMICGTALTQNAPTRSDKPLPRYQPPVNTYAPSAGNRQDRNSGAFYPGQQPQPPIYRAPAYTGKTQKSKMPILIALIAVLFLTGGTLIVTLLIKSHKSPTVPKGDSGTDTKTALSDVIEDPDEEGTEEEEEEEEKHEDPPYEDFVLKSSSGNYSVKWTVRLFGAQEGHKLYMYDEPSDHPEDLTPIARLSHRDKVYVTDPPVCSDEWIKVRYNGTEGWILREYVWKYTPVFEHSRTVISDCTVYSRPRTGNGSEVITELSWNDEVFVNEYPLQVNGWTLVYIGEYSNLPDPFGWVRTSDLS